jgi:hypothetical protein
VCVCLSVSFRFACCLSLRFILDVRLSACLPLLSALQVGGVPTAEINQMELDFLFYVSFRLHVPTDEFQSYRTLFHGRIVSAEKPMENPSLSMMGYSKPQDTMSSNNAQYSNAGVSNGGETCQQQNGWTDRQQQNSRTQQHWSGSTAVLQQQQNGGNNFDKRRAGQDAPDPHSEGWTQQQQQNQHLAQQQQMHGSAQQWGEGREDTEMFEDEALHTSGASNVSACKPVFGGKYRRFLEIRKTWLKQT